MHEATPAMPAVMTSGPDVRRDSGRARARVTAAAAPMSPTKVMAKTRIGGTTSPSASPATPTPAAPSTAAATTGPRLLRGGKIAARAQPSAKRHRPGRVGTWASSAVIAAPQSRRSSGSVAIAAASSRAGESGVVVEAGASASHADHSSQAVRNHGCGEHHRRHDELGPLDVGPVLGQAAAREDEAGLEERGHHDGRPVEDGRADECPRVHVPSQDSRGRRPRSAPAGPTSAASSVASARPGPVSR